MTSLNQSMRPVASFVFESTAETTQKLCLFPGHFMLGSVITISKSGTNPLSYESFLSYANPKALRDAGYECDQVADDYNLSNNLFASDGASGSYSIKITSKTRKTRYRDFLNYIKLSGVRVVKMRITDLKTNSEHAIFNQEIEVTKSSIGSKAGSDYIQLSQHINPSNFLQNFIEVDLEKQNLLLDETTLAFLDVPAGANFQIDFTLAE